jgi:cellulose synthase/poly-beta-1,6-N-acetylglucosamine synthase-like glycosyltransferase
MIPGAYVPWQRSRATALVILVALAVFESVKLEFRLPHSNIALYAYGVTVTALVLMQMFIAFTRYTDLALADPTTVEEKQDGASPPSSVHPTVSCIVAVHNEELIMAQCVHSLVAQTYEPKEIIVVDDASTDRTPQILHALAARCPIKVIRLKENVGKKRALAAGMLHASGEIFAFTDSDSIWAPDALERTATLLANHPEVGAVSGHCRALNRDRNLLTKIQDSWYEGQFSVRKAFESVFGAVTCVSGPLAVFRREAIYNYIPAWVQDRFLGEEFRFATDRTLTGYVLMSAKRAEKLKRRQADSPFLTIDYPWQDWRSVYAKSARAWTEVPDTFGRMVKQQVRWKKSFLRNIFFTGSFYWRRSFLAALLYYLHILFVLAGPFVAFRHLILLPLQGNVESAFLYLFGILLIGSMFGLAFWREEPQSDGWVYRPLMSLMSTTVLSWLLFYALFTIRKMTWARG